MVKRIRLKSKDDVEKINKVASKQSYDVHVSSGHLILNAKSLLALFALVGKAEVFLVAPDHLEIAKFNELIKEIGL